jgi:hypothetical protein
VEADDGRHSQWRVKGAPATDNVPRRKSSPGNCRRALMGLQKQVTLTTLLEARRSMAAADAANAAGELP